MTENIAYIGSANFSDESQGNHEMGILIRDKLIIDDIRNSIFSKLKEDSMLYQGTRVSDIKLRLASMENELEKFLRDMKDEIFESDITCTGQHVEFFNRYDPYIPRTFTETIIPNLKIFISEIRDYVYDPETNLHSNIQNKFSSKLFSGLESQLSNGSWSELQKFDRHKVFMQAFEDNLGHYDDSDALSSYANEVMFEQLQELGENTFGDFEKLEKSINLLCKKISAVRKCL